MLVCPKCKSTNVEKLNYGKRVGAGVGGVVGAAGGWIGLGAGAEAGGIVGAVAGPVGAAAGAVVGGIIGALTGGVTGVGLGAAAGGKVDEHILNNLKCHGCGYAFNES